MDLVYLWCSYSKERQAKISCWKKRLGLGDSCANVSVRFSSHDELKYSLRSAEKYLPEVKRVFVITDDERPDWLVDDTDFLRVIDHKDIIPKKYLPTFNSNVIEMHLHNIPGLSEDFLYMNDDMFMNAELDVCKNYFVKPGMPIYYGRAHGKKGIDHLFSFDFPHLNSLCYNVWLANSLFGTELSVTPSHGMDAYNKTILKNLIENSILTSFIRDSLSNKFRQESDIGRHIIMQAAAALGKIKLVEIPDRDDKICCMFDVMDISKYRKLPKCWQFCINDHDRANAIHYRLMEYWLSAWFPKKSRYEK